MTRPCGLPAAALAIPLAILLASCAITTEPPAGVSQGDDGPPIAPPPADIASIPDAVPKPEPLSQYGNPDVYEVAGLQYHVLTSAQGYTETGMASWYGRKFHGERTSSGETYDMYAMTAAHKRLPLPSYVRVTNLDNGHEVVVRVNDRGPFHSKRIIDVSYAAAVQLGMIEQGTARVKVEAITVGSGRVGDPANPALYLQTGAFADATNARDLAERLEELGMDRVFVSPTAGEPPLFRVRLGPFPDAATIAKTRKQLEAAGIASNTLRD